MAPLYVLLEARTSSPLPLLLRVIPAEPASGKEIMAVESFWTKTVAEPANVTVPPYSSNSNQAPLKIRFPAVIGSVTNTVPA